MYIKYVKRRNGTVDAYLYRSVRQGKTVTGQFVSVLTPKYHSVRPKKTPLNEIATVSVGGKVSAGKGLDRSEYGLFGDEYAGHRNVIDYEVDNGLWSIDEVDKKGVLRGRYIDKDSSHYTMVKKFVDRNNGRAIVFWGDMKDETPVFLQNPESFTGFEKQIDLLRREGVPDDTEIGVGRANGEIKPIGTLGEWRPRQAKKIR